MLPYILLVNFLVRPSTLFLALIIFLNSLLWTQVAAEGILFSLIEYKIKIMRVLDLNKLCFDGIRQQVYVWSRCASMKKKLVLLLLLILFYHKCCLVYFNIIFILTVVPLGHLMKEKIC